MKFKTVTEASTFLNDYFAENHYGWKRTEDEKKLWCLGNEVWGASRHNINITDNFEQGMELVRKLKLSTTLTSYFQNNNFISIWIGVEALSEKKVKFIHSWSFTVACAIYELLTNDKIEIEEVL